jgi:hypothetical protein
VSGRHLSVVVTIVDGGAALRRCLTALTSQAEAPPLELVVPYDSTLEAVAEWSADFPTVTFVETGLAAGHRPPSSAREQHALIDRRRAVGLAAATGDLVGVIEDRGVPRPDWAATAVRLHRSLPNLAIGGAVENARDRSLNWAVYWCDFGRYQLPFERGPRHYLTDVNVVYKRQALERTRDIWRDKYHEPLVHWALEGDGETLLLTPELVVDQMRDGLTVTGLLEERVAWGRLFGSLRVRESSTVRRIALTAIAPLLPAVLFWRLLRDQIGKRTAPERLIRVAPAALLLLTAWALGEALGYATGKA